MRTSLLTAIFAFFAVIGASESGCKVRDHLNLHHNGSLIESRGPNSCITFQVGSGTGCGWMCSYCANQLGTNNYYFTTGVCQYQTGGCVGNPQANTPYTCCSN
jgi:hypothetical protein